jgi:predicted DNA-binding protein (UPF0251 family)
VKAKRRKTLSEQEAIKKLRDLKERMTLHELSRILDVQQTTLWRWLQTGK